MQDQAYWSNLLQNAPKRPVELRAEVFDHAYQSFSQPRRVMCSDGNYYVLKGQSTGKVMVNEQLVGRLGVAMGAPVGEVALVQVPQELINAESRMAPIVAGTVHGSRFLRYVSPDREDIANIEPDANRERFCRLAVLYGWIGASDHQVLYGNSTPRLVHSVDHGHFFPFGPDWTLSGLTSAQSARPDSVVMNTCALSSADLEPAMQALAAVAETTISEIIASIPDEWPFSPEERVQMALYLDRRRDEISLTILPPSP